jgi:CheY-like chemotaxis protein
LKKIAEQKVRPPVKTVLLVDDNADTRILTKWFLDRFGYHVDSAQNAEDAVARFNPEIHDLVLTDNIMPGMSGVEMVIILKKQSPATPIIIYSGNPPKDCPGVDLVILKPTHLLDVKEAIDDLLTSNVAATVLTRFKHN